MSVGERPFAEVVDWTTLVGDPPYDHDDYVATRLRAPRSRSSSCRAR